MQKRLWDEIGEKTKARTIKDDKWKGKDTQNSAKEMQLRTSSKSGYTFGT